MADARASRQAHNLRKRISSADQKRWRAVCSLRGVERPILRGFYPFGSGRLRPLLRSVRSNGAPRPHGHPNGTETGLLLLVALRPAVLPAAVDGDTGAPDRSGSSHRRAGSPAIFIWRRRKELAPPPHCGPNGTADCGDAGNTHSPRWIHAVESAHERLERRPGAATISAWQYRT